MPTAIGTINKQRLHENIVQLGRIGRNATQGLDRITFSDADLEARQWLMRALDTLALDVTVDTAANIWATRQGTASLPPITIGSHLDTVPNGGQYDGALGVLIALEILTTLHEQQITTKHPISLVSFTAEEPNPFQLSTFGSRVVTGKLTSSQVTHVTAPHMTLAEGLARAGGDIHQLEAAQKKKGDMAAFIEVHIEQGKRLLRSEQHAIGLVTAITGIYREEIMFVGEANHAGTTLMRDRKDALVAASAFVGAFHELLQQAPSDEVVGTIGQFVVKPGAPSIIPNEVTLLVEVRGDTQEKIAAIRTQLDALLETASQTIVINRRLILDQAPTKMDTHILQTCEQAISPNDDFMYLGSMAGHDATHLASITKAAMLFVASYDGKSHCPEEYSDIEDIEKVANVLLRALLQLDETLETEEI